MSNRITCEPASNVPVQPTRASFQASGPRFTKNSETMLWLPGGRNAVRSVIKSSRLVRPPIRLVANPTMMSSAGKNARNKLNAIACEIMPQRGNTRPSMRNVRPMGEGLEAIARHYTHGRVLVVASKQNAVTELLYVRAAPPFYAVLQIPVHHQRVDRAEHWMHKRRGKPADNFKAHAFPQPHCTLVAADHKIELHRAKSPRLGALQRMLAHGPRNAAPTCPRRGHVATVRNVRSPALLIRAQIIRAKNFCVFFRDEHFMARRVPIGECFLAIHFPWQGVSIPAANHGFENLPDRIAVTLVSFPNQHRPHPAAVFPTRTCARAIPPTSSAPRETGPCHSSFAQTPHSSFPAGTFRSSPSRRSAKKIAAYPPNPSRIPKAIPGYPAWL